MSNLFMEKAFGTLLVTTLALVAAHSQTIIFNSLASRPVSGSDLIDAVGPIGASFSTTATADDLSDVIVKLTDAGAAGTGTTTVSLFSNIPAIGGSGPTPGSLLTTIGTIGDSGLSTISSDYNFSLSTPFALAPDVRYWIVLSSTAGSTAQWAYTASSGGTGVSSEFLNNSAGTEANNVSGPYYMQVTAVPEPSSLALLGLGAFAGCLMFRRKMVLN